MATIQTILDCAEKLFGENGYSETTIDGIAVAAKVAKGAVYHHFKSKQDVFEAVFEAVSARLARTIAQGTRVDTGIIDQMIVSTECYFKLCGDPATNRITLRDAPGVLGHERWSELDARHFGGSIAAALSFAMETGAIQQQPVQPLARMFLAAIQTAALDCSRSTAFETAAASYISSLKAMLLGLSTEQRS